MNNLPKKLKLKLDARKQANALRFLGNSMTQIDFSSNDYLGFSKLETIFHEAHSFLKKQNHLQNGATGSRLLSGNHALYKSVETMLSNVHNSEAALMFNSGYDANIGFFSCVPQRGDLILFDEFIHASIRDGISISHAKSYKFEHNNLDDLENLLHRYSDLTSETKTIYIVTESVFSMDGDSPNLKAITQICEKYHALLVVDEAHAVGVFGENGSGLIQELNLEKSIFARIITFGKALGCHGAGILGSELLKQYLINFSRSFIYTTGLPPHSLATIQFAYETLNISENRIKLQKNIAFFKSEVIKNGLQDVFIASSSAIHCCIISGNDKVKTVATKCQELGFDIKPILSPTVPKGEERLRFCLHSYNTEKEMTDILKTLTLLVNL